MSEIKKGDLVQIIGCVPQKLPICEPFLGLFRTVAGPCRTYPGAWVLDPDTIASRGGGISWRTEHLKKIDPPASGDEVSDRVPLPPQKVTA